MTAVKEMQSTSIADRFSAIRSFSDKLAGPLSPEDCNLQSMPDTSPTRWHLAHTTWFFETFVLRQLAGFSPFDEEFQYLFNSYYNTVGKQFPKPQRGLISRPGLKRTMEYRQHVNEKMLDILNDGKLSADIQHVIEVGLHHEQQHQELILTDIKHALSCNPMLPAYQKVRLLDPVKSDNRWLTIDEAVYEFGHDEPSFAFDNESPRHRAFLHDYSIAASPVTCGQYLEFMQDGGYQRPDHWLSLGWTTVQDRQWDAPLYWFQENGDWMQFTLAGKQPVNPNWPVCHISYFEADAYARWAGHRLPTEFEWEHACDGQLSDQFSDVLLHQNLAIHPTGTFSECMLGGVWEWTSSSYAAYPGYAPPAGALGEYNGKFMCNQYVLRGGSVATSRNHIRPTYRNFFPPEKRWQFAGFRLAK